MKPQKEFVGKYLQGLSSKSALLEKIFEDSSTYQRLLREYSEKKNLQRFFEDSRKILRRYSSRILQRFFEEYSLNVIAYKVGSLGNNLQIVKEYF